MEFHIFYQMRLISIQTWGRDVRVEGEAAVGLGNPEGERVAEVVLGNLVVIRVVTVVAGNPEEMRVAVMGSGQPSGSGAVRQ